MRGGECEKVRYSGSSQLPYTSIFSYAHSFLWYGFFSQSFVTKNYFMEKSREVVEVLNDLVMINNDRINGYQRAIKELKSGDDLKTLFDQMIVESQQIKSDLAHEIQVLHGDVENGTTEMGKIYRAWMEVKAVFTGENRHTILSNCETGEDAAQRAYTKALETDRLPAFIRDLLKTQQAILRDSHDEIRDLRNQYA
jgi:uncharacterized protein (TIGR02284 family)